MLEHLAAKLKVVSEFQTNNDCSGHLSHSGGEYGENSAVDYSSGPLALDAWYNEVKLTNPSAGSFDHSCLEQYHQAWMFL